MQIKVRDIGADCPACHGTDFLPSLGKEEVLATQTKMVCGQCGAAYTYIQLLIQIGDKAIAGSAEMLEQLRLRRDELRAKPDKGEDV